MPSLSSYSSAYPSRALLVGYGSIGQRHLRNLRSLTGECSITVWRHARSMAADECLSGANAVVYSESDAVETHPDIAIIASPAPMHLHAALGLARAGVHLLIEKPLSNSLTDIKQLIEVVRQRGLVVMMGYNLRFYEPLRQARALLREGCIGQVLSFRVEVGHYLPEWRTGDYRQSVTARSELGGGVVLELSHELEYVEWLLGPVKSVWACMAKLSALEINVEDTAEIMLECENGVLGSIHLDMIQSPKVRRCHVVGSDGVLDLDLITHHLRCFSRKRGCWSEISGPQPLDLNETYLSELKYFLECVGRRTEPEVTLKHGHRVLQIALAVKESSCTKRVVAL